MILFRFLVPLLIALTSLAFVSTPFAQKIVSSWFRHDVELRSMLVFRSAEETLINYHQAGRSAESYQKFFDKIAKDERVLAAGICSSDKKFLGKSSAWPEQITCPETQMTEQSEFDTQQAGAQSILVAKFPIAQAEGGSLTFIVLHDLTFSTLRANETRFYLLIFLIVISTIASGITILTARLTLRSWLGRLHLMLSNPNLPSSERGLPRDFLPVVREVRGLLRSFSHGAYQLENFKIEWTPEKLKSLLEKELPGSEVLVVSNREPYIHNFKDGKPVIQRPASGVVTALEPIVRACGGTWIAHGSGSADRSVVDNRDCIAVPPQDPEYTLRRIWLTEEEEQGYYYGLANEGIWPLCHITFVRPNFREEDWAAYKAVNKKFADAVVKHAKTDNPVILVQDYHFALLPRYIRERLPNATIITFWHIPWPNPEVFSICPWREEILSGLLGSSVIGFHTQFHCNNFMDSVDRLLESHINRDQSMISAGDHTALIRPYPISIAWPPEWLDGVASAADCRASVLKRLNLAPDTVLGVGVERFDYTKGIIDRFQAVRELLRHYPQWRGKFTFVQAAAPTRSRLAAYKAVQKEAEELVESINKEFGDRNYTPILLLARHHEPAEVFELFRAANVCIVSSLHDGMNLVAKEFIASREDEAGVLILSTFAGASKELVEALLVNPYDTKGMADALNRALTMPPAEQAERMKLLREVVSDNNVYYWAARILLDAAYLRKRARIEQLIATVPSGRKTAA